MVRIYFNNKPLILTDERSPQVEEYLRHEDTVFIDEFNSHSIKAMIHEMLSDKIHAGVFLHSDVPALLNAFKKKFSFVQAAGGFVYAPGHELLLIFRRGKWDLPKGKRDEGEELEACALREITEETGLQELKSNGLLCITYHTYQQDGKHWLKESHWFMVQAEKQGAFIPQTEEGIEKCEWVALKKLAPYAENTHASILEVLKAGIERLKETGTVRQA